MVRARNHRGWVGIGARWILAAIRSLQAYNANLTFQPSDIEKCSESEDSNVSSNSTA